MKWKADPQDQAIIQVLIALYIFMDRGVRPATASELEDIASKGGVSSGRVRFVLGEALQAEMVQLHKIQGTPSYSITTTGVRWMENNFVIYRQPNFRFDAKNAQISLKDRQGISAMISSLERSDSVFWAKWCAILTGAGILVAIMIALVIK
jgi:hypothetical protein